MNDENIDTIKMVRDIREKQYEEIKNKSRIEIIDYFRKKSIKVNQEKQKYAGKLS